MRKARGFTLIELMTVIFMIAFVSTFAVPGIISWRNAAKLRGAAENLKGDLELAKLKAIQENGPVAINFREDGYQIFIDAGATAGILDADERLMKNISLPQGVKIDAGLTTFAAIVDGTDWPKKTRFKGRGTADNGTAVLADKTNKKRVTVSGLGRITMGNFEEE